MTTETVPNVSTQPGVRPINWIGLTLLLLALLAAVPLWTGPGIVNTRGGGDSPFLFFRLQQLMANLHDGVFPARWMPDAAYGLGYPFFNFYAALPYYFAALFNFLGFDLLTSIKMVQTLGFVFAGFALYGWARRHFSNRWAAWLAAVAYVYAPFHLVNVYVRGDSLSEFYAFIFYPLILWSIDLIFDSPRNWPLLALSYGGLILTHNVSALIFSPFVITYYVLRITKDSLRTTILSLIAGLSLAFALSAFFWLPALGEAGLTQVSEVQTTGYFNYAEHFRAANLIQSSIGFDYSIAAEPFASTPFAMGLMQAIGTVAGLIVLIVTWKKDTHQRFRLFVLIGLALSTFMITPLSKPLWDTLPLLSYSQFPWRFLSIQALFTSLVIGFIALALARRLTLLVGVIGLTLVAAALILLHPDYLPVRADEITPARLQLYEAFSGNIGTTIRAEYLPRTLIPRPYTGSMLISPGTVPLRPIASRGEAVGAQLERHATTQQWQVNVTSDQAALTFPITYWPGWQAFIDGQPIETRAAPDLGTIQVDVPRGDQRVEFKLGNTPLRTGGEMISLIALIIIGLAGVPLLRAIAWGQRWRALTSPTAVLAYAVIVLAATLVFSAQAFQSTPSFEPETMDFVDKPWLHHNLDGYVFGQQATLLDYQISAPQPDSIDVALKWKLNTIDEAAATLSLVAPSTHLFGGPSPITQTVTVIQNGQNTYTLRTPYALPTGMYYVTVEVAGEKQFLQPIWIKHTGEPAASSQFGLLTPAIGLAAVQTQLRDPNRLNVLLQWASHQRWAVAGVTDANYGISLRLRDTSGQVWTSLDTQPGYGFQPTSAWQPGALNDAYALDLPGDLPRNQVYALDVILYRVASQEEVGRTTIDGLRLDPHDWRSIEPPARNFTAPVMTHPLDAVFGDQIQLLGYDLKREGDTLKIDLAWQALRDITSNYKVFAHVFDPATDKVAAQWDALPRDNAYPTTRWIANEVVTETLTIPLTDVPPGDYRIALGLYEPAGRLPISGTMGIDAANQRVILAEEISP